VGGPAAAGHGEGGAVRAARTGRRGEEGRPCEAFQGPGRHGSGSGPLMMVLLMIMKKKMIC
jgi:hypothetical protein